MILHARFKKFIRFFSFLTFFLLVFGIFFTSATFSAPSLKINYQGRLRDASGFLTGDYDLDFKICRATSGAADRSCSALWSETHTNVSVNTGVFNVALEVDPSQYSQLEYFNNKEYYLGVRARQSGTATWGEWMAVDGTSELPLMSASAMSVTSSYLTGNHDPDKPNILGSLTLVSPASGAGPAVASDNWRLNLTGNERVYGIGVDSNTIWYSTWENHKWYARESGIYLERMSLDKDGNLIVQGNVNALNQLCINGDCKSAWPGGQWTTSGSNIYYNTGNVGIGTTNPQRKLHLRASGAMEDLILLEGNGEPNLTISSAYDDGIYNPLIATARSRGTLAAPTAVQTGNTLFEVWAMGYDGNSFEAAGQMKIQADANASDGNMPGQITFGVTGVSAGNGAAPRRQMIIKNDGRIGMGPDYDPTSDYRLDVSGKINATDQLCIRGVCQTTWPSGGSSQWMTSGSNIYYNSGNVGIGSSNPTSAKLQFDNAIGNKIMVWDGTATDRYGIGLNGSNLNAFIPSGAKFSIRNNGYDGTEQFVVTGTGDVGIGVTNPFGYKLDIAGNVHTTGSYSTTADKTSGCVTNTTYYTRESIDVACGVMDFSINNAMGGDVSIKTGMYGGGNLYIDGELGVGVTNAVSKLDVRGKGTITRDGVTECCFNDATLALGENTAGVPGATGRKASISFHNSWVGEGTLELADNRSSADKGWRRLRLVDHQGAGLGLEVTGYLKTKVVASWPPAGDCDEDIERGVLVTVSGTNRGLFVCLDTGWYGIMPSNN